MLRICALLFCLTTIAAQALAGPAKLTECQSTVVFAAIMTQGAEWCGTFPGKDKVLKEAFACAGKMTKADIDEMVDRGKADMYKNFLKFGAKASCDILADGMRKVR